MKRSYLLGTAAVLVILPLTVLCASPRSGWAQEKEEGEAGDQDAARQNVAATIDGEPITWDEVNRAIAVQLYDLSRQARELRMQQLQEIVERRVLEKEAEKRGLTVEELLRGEVESQVGEVTDEEVDALLAERGMDGSEENVGRARSHLRNLQWMRRYRDFVGSLDVQSRVEIHPLPMPSPPVVEVSVDEDRVKGPGDAPITIVEFGDFTCGYCRRSAAVLERVLETYGDKVRLAYRDFPLGNRTRGWRAAEAAKCAGAQGKFWEYHDVLFKEPGAMNDAALKDHAGKVGLEEEVFTACLDSGRFADEVKTDKEAGSRAGVRATPTFFVNGRYVRGAQPYSVFKQLIDDELRRLGLL